MLSICVCGLGGETSLGADSDVTAEEGRGRERCSGLFRLPSFRPAAAQWERCQLGGGGRNSGKLGLSSSPWALVIITSPSARTQAGTEGY